MRWCVTLTLKLGFLLEMELLVIKMHMRGLEDVVIVAQAHSLRPSQVGEDHAPENKNLNRLSWFTLKIESIAPKLEPSGVLPSGGGSLLVPNSSMAPAFLNRFKGLFQKEKPEKRKKTRETKEDRAQPNPLLDSQIREAAFNGTLCRNLKVGKPVFAACSLPDDCPGNQDGHGLPECACSQIVETIPVTVIDDLLSRKADINGHNHDGFTALHFAASRGVYTLHIAYCISPCIQLTTAVVGHEANIRALLTRGAKASAEDSHGNTPLHIAALNVGAWTPWDSIVESEHPQWVHVYSVHDARTCMHVCAESRAFVRILVNTQFRPHAYAHTPGGPKGSCPTNETSEAD